MMPRNNNDVPHRRGIEDSPFVGNENPTPNSLSMLSVLGLWYIGIVLAPIYIFPSGMPQPSDWLFLLLFVWIIFLGRLGWDALCDKVLKRMALFVAYSVVVNVFWALYLYGHQAKGDGIPRELLLSSAYYAFNFAIGIAAVSSVNWLGTKFINCALLAVMTSSIAQAVVASSIETNESIGERTTGFFENPNQLGYFAVLNSSLLLLLSRSRGVSRWLKSGLPFVFLALLYISIQSSSRAGLIGVILACAVMYVGSIKRGVLVSIVAALFFAYGYVSNISDTLMDRSVEKNNSIADEIAYRGYDRIWNHPHYLIFGAGEGEYERFRSEIPLELHSTPGTLLFCYGIVGSLLFLCPVYIVAKERGIRMLILLVPVASYGLSHQGLRQSEFWLLLLLLGCLSIGNEFEQVAEDDRDADLVLDDSLNGYEFVREYRSDSLRSLT